MAEDSTSDRPGLLTIGGGSPGAGGREFWRSLRERAAGRTREVSRDDEFPPDYFKGPATLDRREFWKLGAASLGLAALAGCTKQPLETIVPYVEQPEQVIPGKPLFFATAMPFPAGGALGLLVESHLGRPTKVEGNPRHPASLGATDAFAQAAVLGLYDPDRSQVYTSMGRVSSRVTFAGTLGPALEAQRASKGAGLRLLTQTVTSPALARQIQALLAQFPEARWHQYEPGASDAVHTGARLAFGQDLQTYYRLDQADVILSLDADFLTTGSTAVRYARDFASRRRAGAGRGFNRLYAVESCLTPTGGAADHRLPLRSSQIEGLARALARAMGLKVEGGAVPEPHARWLQALARDLEQHRGASLVIPGQTQPAAVHALAHALNHALGNAGRTVIHTAPIAAGASDQGQTLRELVDDMRTGRVQLLVILGGNPVYDTPADLAFGEHLMNVALRMHLSLYQDETSALCQWHIPEAHFLESWGEARAFDGTASIIQPLIAPLYGGRTAHEVLAALLGQQDRTAYDLVREYWRGEYRGQDFETFWRRSLHDGLIAGSAFPPVNVAANREIPLPEAPATPGTEIVFRPDPSVWDGRFANNGWLQELPRPITKITWDNAALISNGTAERLGVSTGDVVELATGSGQPVRAPVWVLPGHADESVTVHLGYGRARVGRYGRGAGFNAYLMRPSSEPWIASGRLQPARARYTLASTQEHYTMAGRHPVRSATLAEFQAHPEVFHQMGHEPPPELTLYPEHKYEGYAWGMAIDLNACTGCNACVVACQAENNIPVVGKEEVSRGREMHWLRIDTYYQGEAESPAVYYQPMLCMHCENAPCEVVCPVGATVHSSEGLNEMVYNRCVGTRYCSNNCPYKVRRFNFFQYADGATPSLRLLRNPDVTVRTRGVMEKCTYCVQRINAARIEAEVEGRRIPEGGVVTACQGACPTRAIVFGDINNSESRVAALKRDPLNYGVLADLNTRPRTTYLGRLRNPNPEIERA